MAALSNYFQNKFIDWLLRAQSYSPPATVYVALVTTASTPGSIGTEVSGGSYARVAITSGLTEWAGTQGAGTTVASTGTTGQTSNNAAITYPSPTGNWGTAVGFSVMDAATGGNEIFYAPMTAPLTINNGAPAPSFAISALTFTTT